jgi:hypothetical protein
MRIHHIVAAFQRAWKQFRQRRDASRILRCYARYRERQRRRTAAATLLSATYRQYCTYRWYRQQVSCICYLQRVCRSYLVWRHHVTRLQRAARTFVQKKVWSSLQWTRMQDASRAESPLSPSSTAQSSRSSEEQGRHDIQHVYFALWFYQQRAWLSCVFPGTKRGLLQLDAITSDFVARTFHAVHAFDSIMTKSRQAQLRQAQISDAQSLALHILEHVETVEGPTSITLVMPPNFYPEKALQRSASLAQHNKDRSRSRKAHLAVFEAVKTLSITTTLSSIRDGRDINERNVRKTLQHSKLWSFCCSSILRSISDIHIRYIFRCAEPSPILSSCRPTDRRHCMYLSRWNHQRRPHILT